MARGVIEMVCVLAPVLHEYVVPPPAVSVAVEKRQRVAGAVIEGVGSGLTVTA